VMVLLGGAGPMLLRMVETSVRLYAIVASWIFLIVPEERQSRIQ
jgi:hypothetical protein